MNDGLRDLLRTLEPRFAGEWVFCVVSEAELALLSEPPLMIFREEEGMTVLLPVHRAGAWDVRFVATRIILTVPSSLEAVGLTRAVSTALAARGISANMVAAVSHDHLFVPPHRAQEAMECLRELSRAANEEVPHSSE